MSVGSWLRLKVNRVDDNRRWPTRRPRLALLDIEPLQRRARFRVPLGHAQCICSALSYSQYLHQSKLRAHRGNATRKPSPTPGQKKRRTQLGCEPRETKFSVRLDKTRDSNWFLKENGNWFRWRVANPYTAGKTKWNKHVCFDDNGTGLNLETTNERLK